MLGLKLECLLHVSEPPVGRFATRRKSVFAETYNPEEDEEDDGFKVRVLLRCSTTTNYHGRFCGDKAGRSA